MSAVAPSTVAPSTVAPSTVEVRQRAEPRHALLDPAGTVALTALTVVTAIGLCRLFADWAYLRQMLAVVIGPLDLLGRRLGDGDARASRYVTAPPDGARRAHGGVAGRAGDGG